MIFGDYISKLPHVSANHVQPVQHEAAQRPGETENPVLLDGAHFHANPSAIPYVGLDELDAKAELKIQLEDTDGLTQTSRHDLRGRIDGRVLINGETLKQELTALKGKSGINDVHFNRKEQAYVFNVKAWAYWILWDNFQLKLKANDQGQLMVKVEDNWFPDDEILGQLKGAIQKMVKEKLGEDIRQVADVDIQMNRKGDRLFFTPAIRKVNIPLGNGDHLQIDDIRNGSQDLLGSFSIDSDGHLHIDFDNLTFNGSSDPKGKESQSGSTPDRAELFVTGHVYQKGNKTLNVTGAIALDIDEQETHRVKLGGKTLSKYVQGMKLHANIASQMDISADNKVQVKSKNQWRFDGLQIEGKTYRVEARNTDISLSTRDGLKIDVRYQTPNGPYVPSLSKNTVEPIIDGPAYYEEMLSGIRHAKESIELESYLFYEGEKTRQIARDLALKAAGLRQGDKRLNYDPLATRGIPVHVMFNTRLTQQGVKESEKIFQETVTQLKTEIDTLPISDHAKTMYKNRLDTQLHWQPLAEGIARADHRKLLIIDGQTGYTGGINMGNHFLQEDSYHDVMLKINGPGVREMQQEFIENWQDFGGTPESHWNQKSIKELEKHRDRYARENELETASIDIITTDTDSNEIESAVLSTINKAQKEINIEHAYFLHAATLDALKQALRRGVTINITVPERSDEELFDIINTDAIRQLMNTQRQTGKGQVNAYLYTGKPGKYSHTAHTKGMSVDGKYAIIGSANLTTRSLHPGFQQVQQNSIRSNIFFNEEMDFYIDDENNVGKINRELFERDRNQFSHPINYSQVQQRIRALGGESKLQEEKLKAWLG